MNAVDVIPNGSWLTPFGTYTWLCDNQAHANGITAPAGTYMTFRRYFCLSDAGDVSILMYILNDNYVGTISVDGLIIPGCNQSSTSTTLNYATIWSVPVINVSLPAGRHYVDIKVIEKIGAPAGNPIGLSVSGAINAATPILVNDYDPSCTQYACSETGEGCSDECYWTVQGNHIHSGNNVFGTLSFDDVNVKTNATTRGVFAANGWFGWNRNTSSNRPTTLFDVDCSAPTEVASNIRFEHLQKGQGHILVIDDNGFVMEAENDVASMTGGGKNVEFDAMKQEIRELKTQLADLRTTIATGYKPDGGFINLSNELYQNNPNPFGTETSIGFNIVKMQQTAFIAIYDLNGRELYKYIVTAKGKGSVTVSGEKLVPGQYLYSLIVDGREEATKKMVVIK